MGLDMYLYKKTYVWDDENYEVTVKRNGEIHKSINPEKIKYIVEEVMYWRKANQIHEWFVNNVQNGNDDCASYHVSVEQLENLKTLCDKVLAEKNQVVAEELLPTAEGFFFGSTDYDEYYYSDLEETSKALESILAHYNGNGSFVYESSW